MKKHIASNVYLKPNLFISVFNDAAAKKDDLLGTLSSVIVVIEQSFSNRIAKIEDDVFDRTARLLILNFDRGHVLGTAAISVSNDGSNRAETSVFGRRLNDVDSDDQRRTHQKIAHSQTAKE